MPAFYHIVALLGHICPPKPIAFVAQLSYNKRVGDKAIFAQRTGKVKTALKPGSEPSSVAVLRSGAQESQACPGWLPHPRAHAVERAGDKPPDTGSLRALITLPLGGGRGACERADERTAGGHVTSTPCADAPHVKQALTQEVELGPAVHAPVAWDMLFGTAARGAWVTDNARRRRCPCV